MPSSSSGSRPAAAATLAAVVALVAAIHGPLAGNGLRLDDYLVLRPWTRAELAGVWHGTWDPLQFEPHYFRPLTAWLYAADYRLFGLHAGALHLVSLAGLIVVACLVARFVRRESRSLPIGLAAAALYVAHPCVLHSEAAWVFNQMHLAASICVLLALIAWQQARGDTRSSAGARWWPVWAWAIAGTLFKEDALIVVPAVLGAQWLRARTRGDVRAPSRHVVLAATLVVLGLAGLRTWALGGFGGFVYGSAPRGALDVLQDLARAPVRAAIVMYGAGAAQAVASTLIAALVALGLAATVRDIRSRAASLWPTGACVTILATLPMAFASGPSRFHLVALGAVLMATAGIAAIVDWPALRSTAGRASAPVAAANVALIVAATLVVAMALCDVTERARYAPCSDETLHFDAYLPQMPGISAAALAQAAARRSACATAGR